MKRAFLLLVCVMLLVSHTAAAQIDEENRTALYRATVSSSGKIIDSPDGKTVRYVRKGYVVDVLGFDPKYVYVRCYDSYGYLLRDKIENVHALDDSATPPYGVEVYTYLTVASSDLPVWAQPEESGEPLITLHSGARVGLIGFENGWGKLIFKRQYGYIRGNLLDNLVHVSGGTDEDLLDAPISIYTSFYNIAQTNTNINRMVNLQVACQRLNAIVLAPGERLDFNAQVGPYKASVGYQPAPMLANGTTQLNYGGGTCQVSSTLYNTVLQLPGLTVLRRRPHGPSGASYLPHGVDAAVGNSALNLIFRNDYDFPIRFDAYAQDGALTINIWKTTQPASPAAEGS